MPNWGNRAKPLTDDEVIQMRELRATGGRNMSLSYLAWLFETTVANVHLIVTGVTHKNAGGPITLVKDTLAEDQVVAIRERRAEGIPYAQISGEFGKTEVALRSICSGKSFPNVGGPIVSKRVAA